MAPIISAHQFSELFTSDTPLLDVRAPCEYNKGSFPAAINIPLLDDEQRRLIGIEYKNQGQQRAIQLGHELIPPPNRQKLLTQWIEFFQSHPTAPLYCFRGGQRSQYSQQWLQDAGVTVPRIAGGYKALRSFLLDTLEVVAANGKFVIAGGKTGTGKTHLINSLNTSVDLEARANHRGSAFGPRTLPQPSQIDFENTLAVDFLKLNYQSINRIILEDESHSIGSVHLPKALYEKMRLSPLAIIESPIAERVSTIFYDYILCNFQDFQSLDKENAPALFTESLQTSLEKIKKRLGPEGYIELSGLMAEALQSQFTAGDSSGHKAWIELLLKKYYDPMYEYQLSKKHHRIVFRGDSEEFLRWAHKLNGKKI